MSLGFSESEMHMRFGESTQDDFTTRTPHALDPNAVTGHAKYSQFDYYSARDTKPYVIINGS